MDASTLNFTNSVLPMLALCALAVFMPRVFLPRNSTSHRDLFWAVIKTIIVCYIVGAAISAILYASVNEGTLSQFLSDPLGRANFFLGRSVWFAILWLPLVLFMWLVGVQHIEQRKGLMMRDDGNGDPK
jgi:hypothetical protein